MPCEAKGYCSDCSWTTV